jgi:ATP-dependent exoDNAse (exonuclease V) beta subunit
MSDRDIFLRELDANFSVQAAAGTGKTTALVARVAEIARRQPETLAKLVVVTYTHRAADEMRQRLREKLLKMEAPADGSLWQGLSRMFIGTIHGFCLRLIGEHGLWLGYGAAATAADENDPELYRDFERSRLAVAEPAWLAAVHRVIPARDIAAIARQLSVRTVDWTSAAAGQDRDWAPILAALRLDPGALQGVKPKMAKSLPAVERWRRHWEELAARWNGGEAFVHVPLYDGLGGAELKQQWPESLAPWADTLLRAALHAAVAEAAAFQEFRLRSGRLLFSDQIVLAHRLLRDPGIRGRLLAQDTHILLDEAQDTDPLQFELLAELARPPESAPFAWPRDADAAGPRAGRFIMVGDAQQAIYRDRATIAVYRRYHEAIGAQECGRQLTFAETYRCRPCVAAFVNHRFAHVLNGAAGQAAFVPLQSGTKDGQGQVVRWVRPPFPGNGFQKASHEARWLARRMRELGPSGLRARGWDEVAILCPKRAWLGAFHEALRAEGIPSVLHFDRPQADQPEYLWLAALLTLHVEPNNEFEIAGVLREIYGVSDDALYRFRYGPGAGPAGEKRPLRLAFHAHPVDEIERRLDEWQAIRDEAERLPLADAVALWATRTGLRGRLAALPDGERLGYPRGLERLLLRAHVAQGEGKNLREFHRDLLLGVDRPGAAWTGPQQPQVQLMTMKKAKGLQWDAVILPFLGHIDQSGGRGDYPKIVCPIGLASGLGLGATAEAEGLEIDVALAGAFHSRGLPAQQERDDEEELRERGRLFYVACTRARYTLILVDDAQVWEREGKEGIRRLPSPNGYEALRGPGEAGAEGAFVNPLDLSADHFAPEATPAEKPAPIPAAEDRPPADPWPAEGPRVAIPHRGKKLPSRHEDHDPQTEAESEQAAAARTREESLQPRRAWIELGANESLAYGVWWHETLRRWPWAGDEKQQKAFLAEALLDLPEGPGRERAAREIAAFAASPLCQTLAALPPERRLQEIPYTRSLGTEAVEEGQIDLVYQDTAGAWVLLDWKTDAPTEGDAAQRIRARYAPQLHAYREAITAFGLPVTECRLYSTALGAELAL